MSLEKLFTGSATAKMKALRLAEREIARQEMPALRKEMVIA